MSLINKIANFKSSVKYHKFMVLYSFYKEFINLLLLKQFGRKTINIIILPEHIGDVLAFTPFAEKLKKEDKNAYNVWLIKPTYLSILSENNFIDKCISISCDGVAEKFSNLNICAGKNTPCSYSTACRTSPPNIIAIKSPSICSGIRKKAWIISRKLRKAILVRKIFLHGDVSAKSC